MINWNYDLVSSIIITDFAFNYIYQIVFELDKQWCKHATDNIMEVFHHVLYDRSYKSIHWLSLIQLEYGLQRDDTFWKK